MSRRRGKRLSYWASLSLSVGLLVLIAVGSRALRPPFELQVANVEPGGMYDSEGRETLLVDLRLINPSARLAYLNGKQARFQVLGRKEFPPLMDPGVPNLLYPHSTNWVTISVPAAARNVQWEVDYQFEPWQQSMTRSLGSGGMGFLVRVLPKKILGWLWPVTSGPNSNGWQRTEIRSDLIMQLQPQAKSRGADRD